MEHNISRTGGMGRPRQGKSTDRLNEGDDHNQRERAMETADRAQLEDEGYNDFSSPPLVGARPEVQEGNRTNFSEDELDNQDPHNQHAPVTLDSPPQDLNTSARVGEGLKPGTELALEKSGLNRILHNTSSNREE